MLAYAFRCFTSAWYAKMKQTSLRAAGILLVLWAPQLWAEISIADIEAALQAEIPKDLSEQFKPLLKKYNRDQGNKAISIGALAGGGYAAGLSYQGASELAASNSALAQCKTWLDTNEKSGECEILLVGDQPITPGRIMRQNIEGSTPAMAWKVTGAKGDVYLLGTLHILKPTLLPLPKVFDQFFSAADTVVFETNPVLQGDPARQAELVKLMGANPEQQKALYKKADRKVLKKFAKSQGMDVTAFYTAKPVVNAIQITQLKTAAIGYSTQTGVEAHYARQASVQGKPIKELETPAEAFGALLDLPVELQVELLTETIEELHEVSLGIENIVVNWLQGDPEKVYLQTLQDIVAKPELAPVAEGMLDDRNLRWMKKIDQMLTEETSTVIMVGSAHLGGENGLLALIQQRGFTLVQHSWNGTPLKEAQPN